MSKLDWDKKIWKVIDSYFKSTDNYLTKNGIKGKKAANCQN